MRSVSSRARRAVGCGLAGALRLELHQVRLHQRLHVVFRRTADRRCGGQRAAAHEDTQSRKNGLVGGRQQPVAPIDGLVQGAVAFVHAPLALRQQCPGGLMLLAGGDDLLQEILGGERPAAGGGQLDRQRQAVQRHAEPRHRQRILRIQAEAQIHGAGTLCKELHGGDLRKFGRWGQVRQAGQSQGRHRHLVFAIEVQRHAARGEDLELRRDLEPGRDLRRGRQQVLEIVQDQQQGMGGQVPAHGFGGRLGRARGNRQGRGDGRRQVVVALDRRQRDPAGAVGKVVYEPPADLQGKASLAHAGRAHQRQQPGVAAQQRTGLLQGVLPADQRQQRGRRAMDSRHGERGREDRFQDRLAHLHAALRRMGDGDAHGIAGRIAFLAGGCRQLQEARDEERLALQLQGRDEEGRQHGEIGQAAAVFEPGDLFPSIADGAAQLILGETSALAEEFERRRQR